MASASRSATGCCYDTSLSHGRVTAIKCRNPEAHDQCCWSSPTSDLVGLAITCLGDGSFVSNVFTDDTADLRPSNTSLPSCIYKSLRPTSMRQARRACRREPSLLTMPTSARVDRSAPAAAAVVQIPYPQGLGRCYELPNSCTAVRVIGIIQRDGGSADLTEDPAPAIFFPIFQSPPLSLFDHALKSTIHSSSAPPIRSELLLNIEPGSTTWDPDAV